eukprot:CAMPEP_0172304510 /NCGR_PEP_ID=MMETSP1058-20130122/5901_1 /TAXON_ID=83371 /ORGANISM="Detonula confervacea, Strain CCMP 353" /LENGTH=1370 /DNA_ID=CAMNT_0013015761 /DNA_START=330 /DNA_END=4439 /DNA_ORIENTATION=+
MGFSDSDSDSDSGSGSGSGSDDSSASDAGVPTQVQTGYNSYGRPSMTQNNSQSFQQQSSEEDDDGSSSDDSDEEPAVPVQPRGKTFRPPVGDGDSSSSSSEDEGDVEPAGSDAVATAQVVNPNPGPPRGKELRLLKVNKSSSDDDEPLVSKKSKTKSKATNGSRKKSAPASKKTASKKSSSAKKRKAPPANNDSDSGSDDEDCIATIVGGSDTDDDVTAVAEIVKSNKKVKTNDGTAKKKASTKKTVAKKGAAKKTGPKKGVTKKSSSSASVLFGMPELSAEKAAAAEKARNALQEAVTSLPYAVSKTHTVRSFGRIKPEYNSAPLDALYSSPHAIFPVGFSCDRFEFSPVHGRIIKMRCDILDGSSLREQREQMKKDEAKVKSENSEPMLVDEKIPGEKDIENLGDGPVFRVTWGEGVEEDKHLEPSHPFDPYVASAHLGGDVDAIAVPLSSSKGKPVGLPEVGMRVSVRFDKCKMYGGAITKVKTIEKQTKNKNAVCNITIQYDDGVTEVAAFPDPDIVVAYQGCPPVETGDGLVTEMNGKPVRSVLAKTPLEAWGKTLLSLGLIDEIMYEAALQTLQSAREEGFNEAKDKLDAVNKKRRDDRAKASRHSMDGDDDKSQGTDVDGDQIDADKTEADKEDAMPEEVELREKLTELQNKLTASKKRSKAASLNLANARIAAITPFGANPFLCRDDSATIESSWMAAAIKKERAKMGNTGNKRKIVNPATMMDKSDTFFVPKIERLVEGLPGTEFAPSYVFRGNRSTSAGNQAWVHEAKIRHQKQQQKTQEKASKATKQAEAKVKVEQERVLKRKIQEVAAADRKRLKEEEDEKKKRERVEKRLSQLNSQMDDRLFKEACMMREKNIMNFVRGMNKEFTRRRKAAELTVGNKVDRASFSPSINSSSTVLVPFQEMLPPVSRPYDAEVVRIWDFLHSFSDVLSMSDTPTSLPTLNSLQDAINYLKTSASDQRKRSNVIELFKGIAIDLCKVISPSLTKTLSSSIPNIEIIGKNGTEGGPQEDADVSCLPVTEWSWREIARMVIINDVLTDLGYSKQESANITKGYRSGGHPNSKEAKRWKKIEESPVVMMYHRLEHHDDAASVQFRRRVVRSSLSTPSIPSSVPSDWRFFLHNIKSRSSNSQRFIKDNVVKALAALKKDSSQVKEAESYIADLKKCLALLDSSGHGNNSAPELHKAKQMAIGVLDSTREKCSPSALKNDQETTQLTDATQEPVRQRMGFQKMYQMSKEQFKGLEQSKEEYMAAALQLKEDLEKKNRDDDEDDDDEDEDVEENTVKESNTSELNEVTATTDTAKNGDSTNEKSENGVSEQAVLENDGDSTNEKSANGMSEQAVPKNNGDSTNEKSENGVSEQA